MYTPDETLLKKYADVLVKFALWGGEGAKSGDVIFVQIPECAKPFYLPLQKAILEVGAHPIFEYIPDGIARHFYEYATQEQITFYPEHYLHGKIDQMTHVISILAEHDKYELKGIDPAKLTARMASRGEYKKRRIQKEMEGKLTWTMALYATPAMAAEVGMSLEEYWDQIIRACYLDQEDSIESWKQTAQNIESIRQKLTDLKIQYVHVVGEDEDLKIKIGSDRQWLGGSGRNIPSFEVFTSPDWRETQGRIRCNQPCYRYGQLIKGIYLKFENGVVVDYDATENKELLGEMLKTENANKLGEFSLTDARHSRITKFMGEILYDENVGGQYGNTHIAIGSSFDDTFIGDPAALSKEDKERLGLNQSPEHTDFISTANRTVTATLEDGSEVVIYKDGQFTV